ncbi:MAG: alanine--tRNA ligase [Acidimicrobiia bacterium]|nr:MAG: alanine--tRNA ligase [Acidimicrobiia bacterium]
MNTNEIRSTFIDFFAERGHTVVPSASLIPVDPTLLLTVAGMVPFKAYLLGEEKAPYDNAVSSQKCVRTEDIDILGTTARHASFFEMLGNFSFGDYFKERAIPLAYELLTEAYDIDPDKLWFTVHETDDEAARIWLDIVGIDPERLQRRDRDNFWQMGVAGPAGPSSEIFYDRGPQYGPDGGPIVDEERFVEICNLVFMQYIQDEPYHVVGDLPMRSIDTGMGLERMAMVLQEVDSLFETDSVRAIISVGEKATGVSYGDSGRSDISLRILADHARAFTFLISDGVVPSNEGRGYILRRLVRRAVRHAHMLGATGGITAPLVDATVAEMGDAYPGIVDRRELIKQVAGREEESFLRTLESGEQLLDVAISELAGDTEISGSVAFKLHDTFGFPIELTEEIANERNLTVDRAGFDAEMSQQQQRARAAFKGAAAADQTDVYRRILSGVAPTEFTGYSSLTATGTVLSLLRDGETVESVEEGQDVEVFLSRSPFYAESGGQVGDIGTVTTETGTITVLDTQLALPGVHGHRGRVVRGYVRSGQDATSSIDGTRRERIRKNHSGTHILHWALRDVLGEHVQQEGSLVAPDRLRFDFSHFEGVSSETLHQVEREVNERVIANASVTTVETSKDDAEKMGAIAFFGDKYGDEVRVVKMGDFSTEFCGGTHVPSTGQIGPLVLVSEGSVGSNIRRVEALTGSAAYDHLSRLRSNLADIGTILRAQPGKEIDAAMSISDRLKAAEQRIGEFEDRERTQAADDVIAHAEKIGNASLASTRIDGLGGDGIRALAFQVRDRLGSGIGTFGSVTDGKAAIIVFVSDDLVSEGISAGDIAAPGAKALGGGGSRDTKLAQAGGPNTDGIDEAVTLMNSAARQALAAL